MNAAALAVALASIRLSPGYVIETFASVPGARSLAVNDNATALGLDTTEQMMGGLRGLAKLARLCTADQALDMRTRIEAAFNGAGEAFAAVLSERKA